MQTAIGIYYLVSLLIFAAIISIALRRGTPLSAAFAAVIASVAGAITAFAVYFANCS